MWWKQGVAVLAVLAAAGCSSSGKGSSENKDDRPTSSASAPGGDGKSSTDGKLPGIPTAQQARTQLAGLKVAPQGSMRGYSRAKFPHWAGHGESCDTREVILQRDGKGVKRDAQCRAVSGSWVSMYDGKKLTAASQADIDHMVPLANAWRSGANAWDQEKRKAFANDLTHPQLLSVSAASNRSKGDQGPEAWQPPSRGAWCTYGRAWTSVKSTYKLTVTTEEKSMLTKMLDTCTR